MPKNKQPAKKTCVPSGTLVRLEWKPIAGYEPMEECFAKGVCIGWINPDDLTKEVPRSKWGTAADWPGKWEAVPHENDKHGRHLDWELVTVCDSYAAAKAWIEGRQANNADEVLPSPRGITSGGGLGETSNDCKNKEEKFQ